MKVCCRLEQKSLLYVLVSFSQMIVYCISLILALAVFNMGVLAMPVAVFSKTICGLLCLSPVFFGYLSFRFKPSLAREPLSYGYPLILSAYSNYLLRMGDRVILKMFLPLAMVGVYHIGYKISSVVNFLLVTPVKLALHPIVLQQEASPEEQKYFLHRITTIYYGFILLAGLFFALFSRELIMLLARQEEYHAAWIIVPLIVFAYVQHGLGNFVGLGMTMAKKSALQAAILVVTAIVNIALNFLLIPLFGIIGAAVATVAAYIVWNCLKMYYSWKFYALDFEYKRLCMLTFLWIAFVLAGLFAPMPSMLLGVALKLLLIVLFPFVIFVSGFLSIQEKELALQTLKNILDLHKCKSNA